MWVSHFNERGGMSLETVAELL